MDGVVLVLNQNYEPLNVCNLPRAFRLLFGEKAEVIEYDHQVIRTPRTEYRAPSVIRLQHLIRRPRPRVKLSRREIFARDRHICQYCGRQAHDMTLDHVVPAIAAAGTRGRTWSPHARAATTARAARPSRRRGSGSSDRRSSHATTSTRSSRRTSPTSTTRRGARTCSWAGTDGVGPRVDHPARRSPPVASCSSGSGRRARRVRRRGIASRHRARPPAPRLGSRDAPVRSASRPAPGRGL